MKFDAVIVGTGPAGTSAARELGGRGWSVAPVEKARLPISNREEALDERRRFD